MNREPRILFIDIETHPAIIAAWTLYEANAVWVVRDTYILSVAYRWQHEKTVKVLTLPDFPEYKKNPHSDKSLMAAVWNLLDLCDVAVAHNGKSFDVPKLNARFQAHKLKPPSPYKIVDTYRESKVAKFDSHKLDTIHKLVLGGAGKLVHTGADLWKRCGAEHHDKQAWATMARYNKRDVKILVEWHDYLRPWIKNYPNLNAWTGRDACPACQSDNVQQRGFNVAQTKRTQRLQCQDCGHWFSKPLARIERATASARSARSTSRTKPTGRTTRNLRTSRSASRKRKANDRTRVHR